jgi:pimeloyl-ACP methyl ester carboxylesterase
VSSGAMTSRREGGTILPRSLTVNTASGGTIAVRAWGEAGPPCVLLHGIGDGAFVWDRFAQSVCADWRVLAVDLPGHGDSDWRPDGGYCLEHYTDTLAETLDGLKLGRLVLIGHSLGGDVATRLARMLGERLCGLVLVDTGPDVSADAPQAVASQMKQAHRPYGSVSDYATWLRDQRVFARPDLLDSQAAQSLRKRDDGWLELKSDPALVRTLEQEHDESWWAPALKRLHAPTLLVRGLASAVLTQATAREMLGLMPDGRMVVVGAAGHGVMSDNPEGFLAAVEPFLAETRARLFSGLIA